MLADCVVCGLSVLISVISVADAQAASKDCQGPYRRSVSGLQKCLSEVVRTVNDESIYWYGRNLESNCDAAAEADVNNVNCYLGDLAGPRKYSLVSRLFSVDPNINHLDQYLSITYASQEGNYSACGADFTMPRMGIDVNPDMPAMWPWYFRNQPTLNFPVESNTFYSIIAVDTVTGNVLYAVVNHPMAEVAVPYRPPLNARNYTLPVAFVVYKQSAGNMQISSKWQNIMSASDSGKKFDLSSFAFDQQLQGPVGMNVMLVGRDPWSADQLVQSGGPNFCTAFIGEGQGLISWIAADGPNVTFTHRDTTIFANPLSVYPIDPIFVREQPTIKLSASKAGAASSVQPSSSRKIGRTSSIFRNFPSFALWDFWSSSQYSQGQFLDKRGTPYMDVHPGTAGFNCRLYTILAVDPTIPKNALATPERPYAQWLVMNADLSGGDNPLASGNIVLSYAPTIPAPQSPPHTIFFFAFEQSNKVDTAGILVKYSDQSCVDFLAGRCLFRITDFIQDFGLSLRAASWINVVNDAYARYWQIKSGQLETDICAGQPTYTVPCLKPGDLKLGHVVLLGSAPTYGAPWALKITMFLVLLKGLQTLLLIT